MVDFLFLVVLTILTSSKIAAPYSSMAEVIHLLTHFPASGQQEFTDSTSLTWWRPAEIRSWTSHSRLVPGQHFQQIYKLFPPDT